MSNLAYRGVWISLVRILSKDDVVFADLVDLEDQIDETGGKLSPADFVGAWANVLVIASNISEVIEIIPLGLEEIGFAVDVINKVENVQSLLNDNELNKDILSEVDWMMQEGYRFKIAGRIFPFDQSELEDNPYK